MVLATDYRHRTSAVAETMQASPHGCAWEGTTEENKNHKISFFLQNSTSMSRIVRTRNTKLREGTINTVTGTLADFGYERTPGWAGRVQKRVFENLRI